MDYGGMVELRAPRGYTMTKVVCDPNPSPDPNPKNRLNHVACFGTITEAGSL